MLEAGSFTARATWHEQFCAHPDADSETISFVVFEYAPSHLSDARAVFAVCKRLPLCPGIASWLQACLVAAQQGPSAPWAALHAAECNRYQVSRVFRVQLLKGSTASWRLYEAGIAGVLVLDAAQVEACHFRRVQAGEAANSTWEVSGEEKEAFMQRRESRYRIIDGRNHLLITRSTRALSDQSADSRCG